jgi:HPt (histidine-containing phosphotransfer) domain-containing protein
MGNTEMSGRESELRARMAELWQVSLPHVRKQVAVIQRVAESVSAGSITAEERREAEREAHRLTGSTGSFGFHEASTHARALERLFAQDQPPADEVTILAALLAQSLELDSP